MNPFNGEFLGSNCSISTKLQQWEIELKDDVDKDFLLDGVKYGFRLSDPGTKPVEAEQKNHKSSVENKELIEKELVDQIEKGNYFVASKKPTIVSAVGAIPKSNGKIRLIHDGSLPENISMNDYATTEKVKFQTISDACGIAKPGYYCAKLDLLAAYRSVAIHPSEYQMTGLKWIFKGNTEPTYLFDSRLPFGARKGPAIFHRISQAIRRCMARRGYKEMAAYIDDFLVVGRTFEECNKSLQELMKLVRKLGFYISYDKVEGPSQKITFLGLQICTTDCTLSLGEDKLVKLEDQLRQFSMRKRATLRQLQRLAGSLNYATRAVRGGKFFLRRILDVMHPLQKKGHKAQLSAEFKKDVAWWLTYMRVFNGTVYYSDIPNVHVWVDACNVSAGAFCNGDWCYTVFQCDIPAASNLHINYKETVAVVNAVTMWADRFKYRNIIVHTDSTATKGIINKGYTKNVFINALLRKMFWSCVNHNCQVIAVSVPGALNQMADTISRLHERGKPELLSLLLSYWSHKAYPMSIDLLEHMTVKTFRFLCLQMRKPDSRKNLRQNLLTTEAKCLL